MSNCLDKTGRLHFSYITLFSVFYDILRSILRSTFPTKKSLVHIIWFSSRKVFLSESIKLIPFQNALQLYKCAYIQLSIYVLFCSWQDCMQFFSLCNVFNNAGLKYVACLQSSFTIAIPPTHLNLLPTKQTVS